MLQSVMNSRIFYSAKGIVTKYHEALYETFYLKFHDNGYNILFIVCSFFQKKMKESWSKNKGVKKGVSNIK